MQGSGRIVYLALLASGISITSLLKIVKPTPPNDVTLHLSPLGVALVSFIPLLVTHLQNEHHADEEKRKKKTQTSGIVRLAELWERAKRVLI